MALATMLVLHIPHLAQTEEILTFILWFFTLISLQARISQHGTWYP